MTLVISAVGLAYKAHSDKEQKNKPIFKARRECFEELRAIVEELNRLPRKEEFDSFENKKHELTERATALFIKSIQFFNDEIGAFIDSVRGAIIHYLHGVHELCETGLWRQYMVANDFLMPFLEQKEFFKMYREFELNMFKPEAFDSIGAKSFVDRLKERTP